MSSVEDQRLSEGGLSGLGVAERELRYHSGISGPGVFVGGGPVYR